MESKTILRQYREQNLNLIKENDKLKEEIAECKRLRENVEIFFDALRDILRLRPAQIPDLEDNIHLDLRRSGARDAYNDIEYLLKQYDAVS